MVGGTASRRLVAVASVLVAVGGSATAVPARGSVSIAGSFARPALATSVGRLNHQLPLPTKVSQARDLLSRYARAARARIALSESTAGSAGAAQPLEMAQAVALGVRDLTDDGRPHV